MKSETVLELDPKKVLIPSINTRQPTEADVVELIESIKHSGQIAPAIVRPHPSQAGCYELAAGARRKVACGALKIPLQVIVREIPDAEFEDMILTDNLQREDPDPMQEALLIERRMTAGAAPSEIAAKYGKNETWLRRRMKLLALVEKARGAWKPGAALGHFSTEMMEFVASMDPERQKYLAGDGWTTRNLSSLKALMDHEYRQARALDKADWLEDPATYVEGCGPGCASSTADTLFPDPKNPCGSCLNVACFKKREGLAIDKRIDDALKGASLSQVVLINSKGHGGVTYQGKELRALDQWDFKEVYKKLKKADEGSLLGLDVGDPLKPKLVHLEKIAKGKGGSGSGSTNPGQPESREDKLTGRRLAALNVELVTALAAADRPPTVEILALVAAFGMQGGRTSSEHSGAWDSLDSKGLVPSLDYGSSAKFTREDLLWACVKDVLRQRLQFFNNRDLLQKKKLGEMKRQAELIGFNYDARYEHICIEVVKVPKSWGAGIDPLTLKAAKKPAAKSAVKTAKTKKALAA